MTHVFPKTVARYALVLRQIALKHGTTIAEVIGPTKLGNVVDARREMAILLRNKGLGYYEIGEALHRDHTSIRGLIHKKRSRVGRSSAAQREEIERQWNKMLKLGSMALLRAIYATGKLHGPMSEAAQVEAITWANKGDGKSVNVGWLK